MNEQKRELLKNSIKEISQKWDAEIIPVLQDYIKIPNKSPMFDANWRAHGYMDQAMALIKKWCEAQPVKNMSIQLIQKEERTPLLLIDIAGQSDETILLYGHMDKQPEMAGWDADLGPWKPVLKNDKLYGRGAADDGYATFCALTAIATLQKLSIPHARCVIIIEASEESGSDDLPFYLRELLPTIGTPELIICLDSGAGNFEQLWSTTSLRGIIIGTLSIEVLTEGIHSGSGSGLVPSTMMILRQLLDRIENAATGEILVPELHVEIPEECLEYINKTAEYLGSAIYSEIPFKNSTQPVTKNISEAILNNTWKPALSVISSNLPNLELGGNVTVPKLETRFSMRIPPMCDHAQASLALKKVLEANPPFNATINFTINDGADGWHAPPMAKWLQNANDQASQLFFEKPAAYLGQGGTIPFMGMLSEYFPKAQFLITGVLGPKSNAHGPNEFLHIPMAKKLTGCIAAVIAEHYDKAL